jgi:integrase/recombinase XerD
MMLDSGTVREWLTDCRIDGKQASSLRLYDRVAGSYLTNCAGEVNRSTLRAWLADQEGKAPATQRVYIAIVKLYVKWLKDEGLIEEDLSSRLRVPDVRPNVVTPFTPGETSALLRAVQPSLRDTAILRVLMSSGMRLSECGGILTENVDLEHGCILIHGKGDKWRMAPIDDRAAKAVRLYIRRERGRYLVNGTERLWLTNRGVLTAQGIHMMLKKAGADAGVKDVHAHRLRHGFASGWLADGGSEQGLMTVCGWTDRSMLDRYTAKDRESRALAEYRRLRR